MLARLLFSHEQMAFVERVLLKDRRRTKDITLSLGMATTIRVGHIDICCICRLSYGVPFDSTLSWLQLNQSNSIQLYMHQNESVWSMLVIGTNEEMGSWLGHVFNFPFRICTESPCYYCRSIMANHILILLICKQHIWSHYWIEIIVS